MATITLTVADTELSRAIEALCVTGNMPQSAANARSVVVAFVRQTVIDYETRKAQAAALAGVPAPADPQVT